MAKFLIYDTHVIDMTKIISVNKTSPPGLIFKLDVNSDYANLLVPFNTEQDRDAAYIEITKYFKEVNNG